MADDDVRDALRGIPSTLLQLGESAGDTLLAPSAGAPPKPTASTTRYERVGLLGAGGMGRVDDVRDHDLLRNVAVKYLRPELTADRRMLAQFLWEARVTAYLDHPSVVPVHDLGATAEGEPYFVMKRVSGTTLEAAVARVARGEDARSLALPRRLRVFLQLCQSVAFAHARGVLHRDLKPANVMLGTYGEVLLTDWGLALPLPGPGGEALRALAPEGIEAISAGTPGYMSPEQARGAPLDARSDVYALGAILYELVALRPAVAPEGIPAMLAKVLRGEIPRLATVAPGASSGVVAVVEKAMATDPADRYASATALAAEIEVVLDGRTPDAEQASLLTRGARVYLGYDPGLRRMRLVDVDLWAGTAWVLGVGSGLFLGGLVGSTWWWWAPTAAGTLAVIPLTVRWLRLRRAGGDGP